MLVAKKLALHILQLQSRRLHLAKYIHLYFMTKGLINIALFALVISFYSCDKDIESSSNTNTDEDKKYYKSSLGFWQEFQIDTFTFVKSQNDTSVTKTHFISFLREEITDTLRDFGTPYQYLLKSYRKKNLADNWSFYRNNSILPTSDYVTKNEDDLRYTKLQFPINSSQSWKGNRYIDSSINPSFSNWIFVYNNIHKPFSVGSNSFDSTVTVIQYADSNAIEKTYFYEIYAKNIGLVYAEYQTVAKQNGANPWTMPENGKIIRKSILNWKK